MERRNFNFFGVEPRDSLGVGDAGAKVTSWILLPFVLGVLLYLALCCGLRLISVFTSSVSEASIHTSNLLFLT